jgi:ADP-ribose pyrophosphatase
MTVDINTIPRIDDLAIDELRYRYTTASSRVGTVDKLIVHQTETIYSGEIPQKYVRPVLRHPGGSAVIAIDGYDAICVAQYRPALERMVIEIPGGRQNANEDQLTTAKRELREETGLGARHFSLLFRCNAAPCSSDWEASIYMATGLYTIESPPSPDLPTINCLVGLADIERLVAKGLLMDAKTIAGLFVARQFIG